ncbi:CHAT domain-containing protein, partial [Candidatus Micrarchaeota archaeon]|nr:CHAT domain-containing protein [Candidatus Micrarchaeota archaeon]
MKKTILALLALTTLVLAHGAEPKTYLPMDPVELIVYDFVFMLGIIIFSLIFPNMLNDKIKKIFLDEFTVSYAPSARALYHSLKQTRAFSQIELRLLAINNPQPLPTEIPTLLYSSFELEGISKLFKGTVNVLSEEEATYNAVINALDKANHVHFASHATFESESPLKSGLLLSNMNRLTLSDLLGVGGLRNIR